jgi:hypothetical protein
MEKEFEIQPSLQINLFLVQMKGRKELRKTWKFCIFKRKWRHDSRNALCWSFYCVKNDS